MRTVYLDTETCGLHGMPVIIQYAYIEELDACVTEDDFKNTIKIHEFWNQPIGTTLTLIEELAKCCVVGFNLTFDWFHLCKIYTVFRQLDPKWIPKDHIDDIALAEPTGRDGPCLKPTSALDLMLLARKTEFQCTMDRKDIRLRKIPTQLAFKLAKELNERVKLPSILFARSATKSGKWKVDNTKSKDFKDVVLKFKPSVALKALATEVLGANNVVRFDEIGVPKHMYPLEAGFAPYALAIAKPEDHWLVKIKVPGKAQKKRGFAWPGVIAQHIDHWSFNVDARTYAYTDIVYTYKLHKWFEKQSGATIPGGDDDSVLACMVAAVRWRGYAVDLEGIAKLRDKCLKISQAYPKAPRRVKEYLKEVMQPAEAAALETSGTSRVVLENIVKSGSMKCETCGKNIKEDCPFCKGAGLLFDCDVAERAYWVLQARFSAKEMEIYDKLLIAGRFHASFKIIGALSSRMSGADGLNAQGIKKTKSVRKLFSFAFGGLELSGGDFDSFEISIADAVYADPRLRSDLQTRIPCPFCKGTRLKKGKVCDDCDEQGMATQKIHGLFGMALFPGTTYLQVAESKGGNPDMYDMGKRGIFGMMYGGNANTLVTKLGVTLEVAINAERLFQQRYPGVGKERQTVFDMFCSMRQVAGLGSRIVWHEPADYVESLLGFKRFFSLENKICKILFELANDVPKPWKDIKFKVVRRDREQTAFGATQSAIFAAAFQIQAAAARAASNHRIQSSGAGITKNLQRQIWDLQPVGVHEWWVQPCNVHDEILCPVAPHLKNELTNHVNRVVKSFDKIVPLIGMEWKPMNNWAEK